MKYRLKPYKGAGQIKLGMTSKQIKRIMGAEPKYIQRGSADGYQTERYDGFFVEYKAPGVCKAIEFYNDVDVIFKGKWLFNMSYGKIMALFKSNDKDVEFSNSGLTSYKYGISVYAPFAKEDLITKPEGIMVFEKGYYDK